MRYLSKTRLMHASRRMLNWPRGIDAVYDMKQRLPSTPISVIFDVGANTGQTSCRYRIAYPQAEIHAFEPVAPTFVELEKNLSGKNIHMHRIAIGAKPGVGHIVMTGDSRMRQVSDHAQKHASSIPVTTIDAFCKGHAIDHIGFLKIDTEGGDLDVLLGANEILTRAAIDIVKVEAGMNPANTRHVPFEELKSKLQMWDYYLFGIYEQTPEWPGREPHLRRVDLVFISRSTIARNTW